MHRRVRARPTVPATPPAGTFKTSRTDRYTTPSVDFVGGYTAGLGTDGRRSVSHLRLCSVRKCDPSAVLYVNYELLDEMVTHGEMVVHRWYVHMKFQRFIKKTLLIEMYRQTPWSGQKCIKTFFKVLFFLSGRPLTPSLLVAGPLYFCGFPK